MGLLSVQLGLSVELDVLYKDHIYRECTVIVMGRAIANGLTKHKDSCWVTAYSEHHLALSGSTMKYSSIVSSGSSDDYFR